MFVKMLGGLLLVSLLVFGELTPQERDQAKAELSSVAERIVDLKARHAAGDDTGHADLYRLLVRAQELAILLESDNRPPERVAAPTPDDLRERADAARDEADHLRAAIEKIDISIADLDSEPLVPQANLASAHASAERGPEADLGQRLAFLEARRAVLLHHLAAALAEANRLEKEARRLDVAK